MVSLLHAPQRLKLIHFYHLFSGEFACGKLSFSFFEVNLLHLGYDLIDLYVEPYDLLL